MNKSEYTKKIALWATMFTLMVAVFTAAVLWKIFIGIADNVEAYSNFAIVVFAAIGSFFTGGKLIDAVNAYHEYNDEVERCEKRRKERDRRIPWEEWKEELK